MAVTERLHIGSGDTVLVFADTGFFGVALWLQTQQPFLTEPPTAWVRKLIEQYGSDPETLVIAGGIGSACVCRLMSEGARVVGLRRTRSAMELRTAI